MHCYKSAKSKDWEYAIDLYKDILLIGNAFEWASMYEAFYDTHYCDLLIRLSDFHNTSGNAVLAKYYLNKYERERM